MNISIRHWFSALLVVTLFDNGVYCSGHSIIEKLLIKLLNGTNHLVRPVLDREESIEVTVGLELIQINKIDETQQYISSKFWSRIIWRNEFMKWNASEYHDMKFIQISAHKVWTPDIVLYNNAANNIGGGLELPNSKITMYPDGSHHWLFPVTYVSSCHMNVLYFPFDGHTCELKFGSWTFNSKYISLRYDDKPLITSHYIHSTEWDLINMNKSKNSIVYEGYGPIPYDDVTFEMKVSRVYLGYIFYMIAPCLLLIMTTLFSFSLPPESGERVTVIVTNLLAFSFFMNCTNEILPTNSDTITIITVFYLVLVAESAVSLLMAVCVLTVFHRGQQYNPPEVPSWLKSCFFRIYTKIYTVEQGEFTKKIPKTVAANLSSIALGALDINLQNETSADNLREKSGSATRLVIIFYFICFLKSILAAPSSVKRKETLKLYFVLITFFFSISFCI